MPFQMIGPISGMGRLSIQYLVHAALDFRWIGIEGERIFFIHHGFRITSRRALGRSFRFKAQVAFAVNMVRHDSVVVVSAALQVFNRIVYKCIQIST